MLSLLLSLSLPVAVVSQCSFPAPDPSFTNAMYSGRWFEIGKIQTKGGAFFERNCVCTSLGFQETNSATGDGIADNDCRYKTVDGRWTNVTGNLFGEDLLQPGRWLEQIGNGSPVNYTVIAISEDYSVEYDCGTSNGITNYCIHVLSREPTLDQATFDKLIQDAENMGLNPQNLPITMTLQEGC